MGGGELKEFPAFKKDIKEQSDDQRLFRRWQGLLFGGLRVNRTYGQCAKMYVDQTGQMPKEGWPGVYESGSVEWKVRVGDSHTTASLYRKCKETQRRIE